MKRLVAILVILVTLTTACSSIESELAEDFTQSVTVQGNAYWSTRSVSQAAVVIIGKQRPLDTIDNGASQFLQYSDAIVAIWDCSATDAQILAATSAATGTESDDQLLTSTREGCIEASGAVVYVDEYQRSRTRWRRHVGFRFGSNVGAGSSFRGRGTGFGK